MNLDLNLLKTFHSVAIEQSISRAAQKLRLTQPAVSLQIKKLEEQVEGELFFRNGRQLVLTPFGARVLQLAGEASAIQERVISLRTDVTSERPFRIAAFRSLSASILTDIMAEVKKNCPQIKFHVSHPKREDMIELLKTYQIDCAFSYDRWKDSSIISQEAFKDEFVLVASPSIKPKKTMSVKDLSSLPLLAYSANFDFCTDLLNRRLGKYFQSAVPELVCDDFQTLLNAVICGLGAAFFPSRCLGSELNKGSLRHIKLDTAPIKVSIYLSYVRQTPISATLNRILLSTRRVFNN